MSPRLASVMWVTSSGTAFVMDGWSDEELHTSIVEAHVVMCAAQRLLLARVAEHDRREAWRDRGAQDEVQYLVATFDVLRATARKWVKAAHTLERHRALADSFSAGSVSADQLFGLVEVLDVQQPGSTDPLGPFDPVPDPTPDPTPDPDPDPTPNPAPDSDAPADSDPPAADESGGDAPAEDPVALADRMSAAQLAAWAQALRKKRLEEANAAHRRRRVRAFDLDGGARLRLEIDLFDDDAAVARAAFDEYLRTCDPDPDTGRYQPLEQSMADAFVEFTIAFLTGKERTANRPAVFFHAEASVADGGYGWAKTSLGSPLAAETIHRYACYCHKVFTLKDRDGNDLYLGRGERHPTWGLAETVRRRDGGCRFPGCRRRRFTHAHHILQWDADNGPTDHHNLCTLCRYHHRLVHEGGWKLSGDARDQLSYRSPNGLVLTSQPNDTRRPPPTPPPGAPPPGAAPPGVEPPGATHPGPPLTLFADA